MFCFFSIIRTFISVFSIQFFILQMKVSIHFQIASHPNIYVLDTPGVLPPHILDDEVCTKLALTGMTITDNLFQLP